MKRMEAVATPNQMVEVPEDTFCKEQITQGGMEADVDVREMKQTHTSIAFCGEIVLLVNRQQMAYRGGAWHRSW